MSTDWPGYHDATKGREPRPLFLQAIELLGPERGRRAIDLGFGDGTESLFLLGRGWSVVAVEAEPTAATALRASASEHDPGSLDVRVARLEDVELPRADLVYAGYSLPYCRPERFAELWQRIGEALAPKGMFAGQLFGPRDSWAGDPDMMFVDRTALDALFAGFDVVSLEEQDEPGDSFAGPKHWHVFHVIATTGRPPDDDS
jgi:SAM-dependent methyltransferase